MELDLISNNTISIILMYISLSSAVSAFVIFGRLSLFLKSMWILFIWMVPFLGPLGWIFIQSFEHKFQMEGGYRQELGS